MSKNILLADDNSEVRSVLKSLIEQAGFCICGEAESGAQAVWKARELQPDLILMDYRLPKMNGAEAATILKWQLPDVPIILFTLHAEEIRDKFLGTKRVERVVSKTDGLRSLVQSIKSVLKSD